MFSTMNITHTLNTLTRGFSPLLSVSAHKQNVAPKVIRRERFTMKHNKSRQMQTRICFNCTARISETTTTANEPPALSAALMCVQAHLLTRCLSATRHSSHSSPFDPAAAAAAAAAADVDVADVLAYRPSSPPAPLPAIDRRGFVPTPAALN